MQPSLDRIERAVVALGSAQLGRGASANLIRWLAVKWAGVGHDTAVVVDRAVTVEFANLYFAVPGMDPYRWFDPFTGNWSKIQANGGWPVGSVLTQIKRPPPSLKGVLVSEEHPPAAMVALPPSDEYLVALHTLLPPGRRVPLADLAIWRYRFGIPESLEEDSPTEEALADALAAEFNLSTPERSILFTEDDEPADAGDTTWYTGQWDPMELAALLPTPRRAGPEEVRAPEPPTDNPQDEQGGYEHLSEYAALPLETADVEALIGRVETAVHKRELLLPDTELIEQCVLGLLTGHIVLQGPPGTGKTTLARALAEAFDASSELQTATADWSTYDVIGGLQPSVGEDEREVLRPWLGHVPRAALRCARVARDHQDHPDDHPEQAHWLIIDEFSRAQVDKAIGGLYTMLGGSGEHSLELWFENDPTRKVVPIPGRFRIIATMNDVDASFVYDFSQGLTRRFQFIYVGVPPVEALDDEVQAALSHAAVWLAAQYPDRAGTRNSVDLVDRWNADDRLAPVLVLLKEFIARVRYPESGAAGGGWPVGTAQLGDVLRRVVLREPGVVNLLPVLDAAIADGIIPQMNGVKPVILESLLTWLERERAADLPRTIRAGKHLQDTAATT